MSQSSPRPALVLFSGLPGTGKSTLAHGLSADVGWEVLAIDDLTDDQSEGRELNSVTFWDGLILRLLDHVDHALRSGDGVIVDSVFMNRDRFHARAIADDHAVPFRPIHTYVSDVALWRRRVTTRFLTSDPAEGVASWEQVIRQRDGYRAWEPGTALFVDGVSPLAHNRREVLDFVCDPETSIDPLPDVSFVPGDYHR